MVEVFQYNLDPLTRFLSACHCDFCSHPISIVSRLTQRHGFANMRAFNFDLQSISFAYENVRAILIEVQYRLNPRQRYALKITSDASSTSQPLDLEFFIHENENEKHGQQANEKTSQEKLRNPHRAFAPWALNLLRGESLSRGICLLVHVLRSSLPALEEFQMLMFPDHGAKLQWIPKGLGWWRVLFRSLRFNFFINKCERGEY